MAYQNNNNRNQRPNKRPNNGGKQLKRNKFDPGKQRHILVDLINQYGPNFPNMAEVYGDLNNKGKMTGLIRTMFSGNFDYDKFYQYVVTEPIYGRIRELAQSYYMTNVTHAVGYKLIQCHPEEASRYGLDINSVIPIMQADEVKATAWNIAFNAIINLANPMAVASAVQELQKPCVFGCPMWRMLE
jgi:hypothetical protein